MGLYETFYFVFLFPLSASNKTHQSPVLRLPAILVPKCTRVSFPAFGVSEKAPVLRFPAVSASEKAPVTSHQCFSSKHAAED